MKQERDRIDRGLFPLLERKEQAHGLAFLHIDEEIVAIRAVPLGAGQIGRKIPVDGLEQMSVATAS